LELESITRSRFQVTNRRILFLVYQSVLGIWSIDWEFTFSEIVGPPPCGKEWILLSFFSAKKFLNKYLF
jgi:hypothetical protein